MITKTEIQHPKEDKQNQYPAYALKSDDGKPNQYPAINAANYSMM